MERSEEAAPILLTLGNHMPIRGRIATIVLLGLATAALSLTALIRAISISNAQRIERAHETVGEELGALATARATSPIGQLPAPPDLTVVGMHGGYWTQDQRISGVPEAWQGALEASISASMREHRRVVREALIGDMTVVSAAEPLEDGRAAWAALLVRPPVYLRSWKLIVAGLMITTTLLVTSAIYVLLTMKRSIQELAGRLAESERLAALGRVVAGVAHEVRNPLASIKLRLDLAAQTPALPPAVGGALHHATSEIERLDRLVADLLVVAGRQIGPKKPLELLPFVRGRVEALAPWSSDRKVSVTVQGAGPGLALADPDSLTRAIDNLLRNAVEASPAGSVVDVSIENGDGTSRIRVDDLGNGISPDRAHELFEPFFTTKSGGMGLGLAISRSIARAHGGDVTYSRLDGRTRFELTLRAPDGARSIRQGPSARRAQGT